MLETLIQPRRQRIGKECKPHQFAKNLRFRPFRMLVTYPLAAEITREQAHLKSQEQPLLSRH
jgi:hypothetical protein